MTSLKRTLNKILQYLREGTIRTVKVNASTEDKNLDNYRTTGIYYCATSMTNAPMTNHGMVVVCMDVGTPFQIYYPDNTAYFYKRWRNNSTNAWNNWTKVGGVVRLFYFVISSLLGGGSHAKPQTAVSKDTYKSSRAESRLEDVQFSNDCTVGLCRCSCRYNRKRVDAYWYRRLAKLLYFRLCLQLPTQQLNPGCRGIEKHPRGKFCNRPVPNGDSLQKELLITPVKGGDGGMTSLKATIARYLKWWIPAKHTDLVSTSTTNYRLNGTQGTHYFYYTVGPFVIVVLNVRVISPVIDWNGASHTSAMPAPIAEKFVFALASQSGTNVLLARVESDGKLRFLGGVAGDYCYTVGIYIRMSVGGVARRLISMLSSRRVVIA